jgi:hypothetical protein
MALFPTADFNKITVEAIEQYVNENEPHLTFEQKEARRAIQTWRKRV